MKRVPRCLNLASFPARYLIWYIKNTNPVHPWFLDDYSASAFFQQESYDTKVYMQAHYTSIAFLIVIFVV